MRQRSGMSLSGLGLRALREGKLLIRRPGVAVTMLLARRPSVEVAEALRSSSPTVTPG